MVEQVACCELTLVVKAVRHEAGRPFPSAERAGWVKGGFLRGEVKEGEVSG